MPDYSKGIPCYVAIPPHRNVFKGTVVAEGQDGKYVVEYCLPGSEFPRHVARYVSEIVVIEKEI